MKLIYIFIQEYRSLKNLNFNLGGSFRFHYNLDNQKLIAEKNLIHLDNFYDVVEERKPGYAFIKNVSAIIGENGTGKTTFLDFIKENFIEGVAAFKPKAILAYEDYTSKEIKLYIHESLEIDIESKSVLQEKGFEVNSYGPKRIIPHNAALRKRFSILEDDTLDVTTGVSYIYFSNVFDKKHESQFSGLYNISTNFLLKEDTAELVERNLIQTQQFFEQHRNNEIKREMDFINAFKNEYKKYLNFELPNRIFASLVLQFDYKKNENIFETKAYYYLLALEEFILRRRSRLELSTYQSFIVDLFIVGLSNIFNEYYKYSPEDPHQIDITFSEDALIFNQDYLQLLNQILDPLIAVFREFYLGERINSLKQVISFLNSYVNKYDNPVGIMPNVFVFLIDNGEQQASFFEFYSVYKNTFSFDSYLNYDWADRSTGEKALLNIYSRFYSLADDELIIKASNLILKDKVMILLDEGELYLHPTWQKELLFQLLKILPIIFKRNDLDRDKPARAIQIIFTSNSPFLISDIPANNIVFLRKSVNDKRKVIVQDSLNDQKQTFAANIHTLLSDSFFLKDYLMGDFAFYRINEVINILMGSKEAIESSKEMIQKTIMMIGEPVIKSKLMQMLNERLSLDMIDLNQRVSQLETEVAQLKQQR